MLKFDFIYKTIFLKNFLFTFAKRIDFYKFILKKYSNSNFIFNKNFLQIIKKNYKFIYKKNFPIYLQRELSYYFYWKQDFYNFIQFNYYLGKWFCNFYLKSNLLVFIWKINYAIPIVLFIKWFFFFFFFFLLRRPFNFLLKKNILVAFI